MKKRTLSPGVPLPEYRPADETEPPAARDEAVVQKAAENAVSLATINVWDVRPNPYAPRQIYTPEMIKQRADSLREHGQRDAIHVIPNPDDADSYIIADGWTRVLACREHKVSDTLQAKIHHGLSVREAAWLGFDQNESREQHSDYDRAYFFASLEKDGLPAEEISKRTGLSQEALRLYRAFTRVSPEVADIIKSHPKKFGAFAANELLKIESRAGVRKAVTIAMQFVEEDKPVRWLASQSQEAAAPEKNRNSDTYVRQIRFANAKNSYLRQLRTRIDLSVDLPEAKCDEIAKKIEAMINEALSNSE